MLAKSLQKYSIWHPSYVSGSPGFPTFWRSEATLWLFVTAPFMKMMHFWPAYWSPDQTESFLTLKMFFACNITIHTLTISTFEPIALATQLVLILKLLIILILTIFIMNWSPAGYLIQRCPALRRCIPLGRCTCILWLLIYGHHGHHGGHRHGGRGGQVAMVDMVVVVVRVVIVVIDRTDRTDRTRAEKSDFWKSI